MSDYLIGGGSTNAARLAAAEAIIIGLGIKSSQGGTVTGNRSLHVHPKGDTYTYGASEKVIDYGNLTYERGFFNLDDPHGFYAFAYELTEGKSHPVRKCWKLGEGKSVREAVSDPKRKTILVGCAVISLENIRQMIAALNPAKTLEGYWIGAGSKNALRLTAIAALLEGLNYKMSDGRNLTENGVPVGYIANIVAAKVGGFHITAKKVVWYSSEPTSVNGVKYYKGFYNLDDSTLFVEFATLVAGFNQEERWVLCDHQGTPNGWVAIANKSTNTIEARDIKVPLETLKEMEAALG